MVHASDEALVASVELCRETAGVSVRVEIGPKEAQNGLAVVALAREPGTVALKETVSAQVCESVGPV